jgi:5'(3')-deoxyribonucleotidase
MKLPRVLVDVDGVLADFLAPSLPLLKELTGKDWDLSEFHSWDIFDTVDRQFEDAFFDRINCLGWCRNIPVFEGAQEAMARVAELADVYVVTSPMNHIPTWMHEREQWLKAHFNISPKKVVHTSAKYLCTGDVLIDDKPANVDAWLNEQPGIGILFPQPYNQRMASRGLRAKGWGDVIKVIEHLSTTQKFKAGQLGLAVWSGPRTSFPSQVSSIFTVGCLWPLRSRMARRLSCMGGLPSTSSDN